MDFITKEISPTLLSEHEMALKCIEISSNIWIFFTIRFPWIWQGDLLIPKCLSHSKDVFPMKNELWLTTVPNEAIFFSKSDRIDV